jgi:hypothetical protein
MRRQRQERTETIAVKGDLMGTPPERGAPRKAMRVATMLTGMTGLAVAGGRFRGGSMSRRRWRAVAWVGVTVLGLGMVAWSAAPASACSTSNGDHCYAIEYSSGGTNHGAFGELYVGCLYMPNNGNRVNNEIWEENDPATYWTEVGVTSGIAYNGDYYNKQWFWADSRPNGGSYHEHEIGQTATAGDYYDVETYWIGNNEWAIYGGNSFTQIGTSTSNPVTSSGSTDAGTEYTVNNASSGIRDVGAVYNIEWLGTNGVWHDVGSAGSGYFNGWIGGSYNASGSYVTWSGPC